MLGLLVAAALAGEALSLPAEPSPYFLDNSTVVQVFCNTGTGSAFYIGDGQFVTAKHVVLDDKGRNAECHVGGERVRVVELGDGFLDYAVFKAPVYPPYRAIISCQGFKEGQTYFATGYAEGNPWTVTQRLIGSNYKFHSRELWNRTTMLRGGTSEGQSGGPVSDNDGLVVGIVSHGSLGGVTEELLLSLSDTPICKRNTD